MTTRRRLPRVITAALAACWLTACGAAASGPDMMTWDQMNQEYRRAAASFVYDLPSGVTFPVDVPWDSEEDARYQRGFGEGRAYIFAEISWACVAIAQP